MSGQVTIQPSGHVYPVEATENILEAGLKYGLALAYGCSNANCGLCKAKLISGEVTLIRHQDTEEEWANFVANAEDSISREHTLWRASRT